MMSKYAGETQVNQSTHRITAGRGSVQGGTTMGLQKIPQNTSEKYMQKVCGTYWKLLIARAWNGYSTHCANEGESDDGHESSADGKNHDGE